MPARLAGTPIPVASAMKSRSGRDRSSRLRAAVAGRRGADPAAVPCRGSRSDRLLKMTVVTSSCSRACVHSAESVYMALPSASSASTGRSGQAIAAPVASGSPWPMAPPVSVSQSCGGAPAVAPGSHSPDVLASSDDDRALGQQRADDRGRASPRSASPSGQRRAARPLRAAAWRPGATRSASAGQRAGHVVARLGQHVHLAAVRHQRAGLARVGEERHRGRAPRPGSGAAAPASCAAANSAR